MVRYTVAVCNYNMAETLERSLRSILDQVDSRFEVVVVDGGSEDGSRDILRALSEEYDQLRVDLREPDPDRYLGGDRNRSFELAEGDYVLESLDCDNRYFDIVQDFVDLYHQLEPGVDGEFLLNGMGMNIAPRQLVLRIPYQDLGGAEDRDWFRRLAARDAIEFIRRCDAHAEQLGYFKSVRSQIERDIHGKICDFQTGVTLPSALRWSLYHEKQYVFERQWGTIPELLKKPYDVVTHIYAYWKASQREQYGAPKGFEQKGRLGQYVAEHRRTAPELAKHLGVDLDCSAFTERGKRVFCLDS